MIGDERHGAGGDDFRSVSQEETWSQDQTSGMETNQAKIQS